MKAANISFLISNPSAKKVKDPLNTSSFLYRGIDNQLDFVFSNNGFGDLPFKNGDCIFIAVPLGIIEGADKSQLSSSSDWMLLTDPAKPQGIYDYVFTPKKGKTITFFNEGSITISLQNLKGGAKQNANIIASYTLKGDNLQAGPPQKLFVFNPPQNGNIPLTDEVLRPSIFINADQDRMTNGKIFVSPTQGSELKPPIANKLHINLTFSGSALVEDWPKGRNRPVFTVSFSYDDDTSSEEALTEYTFNAANSLPSAITLVVKGFEPEVSKGFPISFKPVQTIKGFQALGVTPDLSKLFLNNGDNKLYYVNPFSIPETPSQFITVGDIAKSNFYLLFNPYGKQVFVHNVTPKEMKGDKDYIYYFDSDTFSAKVSKTMDITGTVLYPFKLSTPIFIKGASRVFFQGYSANEPGLYYFDPTDPPQKLNQKVNFPIPTVPKEYYSNTLFVRPDGSEALTYSVLLGKNFGTTVNMFRFNPQDPPQEVSGSVPFDNRLSGLQYTGDGKTIFADVHNKEEIAYFSAADLPVKATNVVNVIDSPFLLMSPKSDWIFSVFLNLFYFSKEKPPAKVTRQVDTNGAGNLFFLTLNPDQSMAFMSDGYAGGNKIYYFDIINPPREVSEVTAGNNSGAIPNIYFTADGSRFFVNNITDDSVSVFEAFIPS